MQDKVDEAQDALRRYLGQDLASDDPAVLLELNSIQESLEIEKKSAITFKEVILCRDRSRHLVRLSLGCGGQFMQQFGGINALNYYFPIILTESLGQTELLARILTGCNATSYMISSGLCFWMIERFGRRSLMFSGLALQCLAYVMVAISVALLATAPTQVCGRLRSPIQVRTNKSEVGCRRHYVPFLLLCSIWMHMGNGPMGVSSRDKLSHNED